MSLHQAVHTLAAPMRPPWFRHSWLALLAVLFSSCAVMLVGPYDEITDKAITDLAYRTQLFFAKTEADGSGYAANASFYRDAHASLRAIRLRAELYPKNTGELKAIDLLSQNFDNLAELHRDGPLTGLAGKTARQLIETNFHALLQIELSKKRSSGVPSPTNN